MNNPYNFSFLEASFREFLISKNLTPITLKNYLSDLRHFYGWLYTQKLLQSETSFKEAFSRSNIASYFLALQQSNIPIKTLQRRLSTLRKFFSFCILQNWLTESPAKHIQFNTNQSLQTNKLSSSNFLPTYLEYCKSKLDQSDKLISQTKTDIDEFFSIINSRSHDRGIL